MSVLSCFWANRAESAVPMTLTLTVPMPPRAPALLRNQAASRAQRQRHEWLSSGSGEHEAQPATWRVRARTCG